MMGFVSSHDLCYELVSPVDELTVGSSGHRVTGAHGQVLHLYLGPQQSGVVFQMVYNSPVRRQFLDPGR